jgi:predicted nucleic acid-binding protein
LAVEAAKTDVATKRKVRNCGLADSIVLSTARERKGKVITGDPHFRELDDAHMI